MGLFGIGIYQPVAYAPPGSISNQAIIAAAAGGVPGVNTMLYTTAEQSDHPLAFYYLNELSGTSVSDSSGHRYTGTITGSMTYNIAGALSGPGESAIGGMQFSGTSYIALPSSLSPASWSALTIELMVNGSGTYTGNPRLVANDHTDTLNRGVQIWLDGPTGLVKFALGSGSSQVTITSTSPLVAGDWTAITATWDGQNMILYWNGQPQAQGLFTSRISTTAFPINLGRNPQYNGDYLTGGLSMVGIYNHVLPASTIAQRWLFANAIGMTLYGGGFSTVPFQLQPPYSGVYGGPYGYINYTNIRSPKSTQWVPAQSIGNDNLGYPVVRGFPQMSWLYSTLRPDHWFFLRHLYRLAGNAPPEYQYLVLIQYPDMSGSNTPVQLLARWEPPIHGYRTVSAYIGVQLKFTYIGQAQLVQSIPIVTVVA